MLSIAVPHTANGPETLAGKALTTTWVCGERACERILAAGVVEGSLLSRASAILPSDLRIEASSGTMAP
jgi:hypothetical protein